MNSLKDRRNLNAKSPLCISSIEKKEDHVPVL